MYHKLAALMTSPSVHQTSSIPFWDDDHISAQMLRAHLDPDRDAASRTFAFMDRSAAWIAHVAPPETFPRLLDLGCGPGLYAQRFARLGYQVTGVDLSRRSIQYAREQAEGTEIRYHLANYCQLELGETFDVITLIYCDYGALSPEDRQRVLHRARAHLRPGGRMVLDVFSHAREMRTQDYQRWQHCPQGGFWRAGPHIVLEEGMHYPQHVLGRQITVITPEDEQQYYLWTTCFTPDSLADEAQAAGFRVLNVYGDVTGAAYSEEGDTLAMVLEKP